jgi:hypothetical protein
MACTSHCAYAYFVFISALTSFLKTAIITNAIDTNEAESHLSVRDEGAVDGNTNNNITGRPGSKQHNDDDDDVDVDGPRVEAHVDLSKNSCKYILRHSILRKYTNLHDSMQDLPRRH